MLNAIPSWRCTNSAPASHRRREENLQEVPVAVTALSAEDLDIRSIDNIRDLQMLLPNVDIPLSDTVLAKVTAASLNRDGHVESLSVDENYGEIDNTILRGMLQWQPNDSFTGLFTATHNNHDSSMQANVLFDVVENFPTPWPWGGGPEWYNMRGIPFTDELYAYGLASGRITYTPAAGNWDVALLGTNLTNEYYRQGGFSAVLAGVDQGVVGRPREIGVTIRLRLQ